MVRHRLPRVLWWGECAQEGAAGCGAPLVGVSELHESPTWPKATTKDGNAGSPRLQPLTPSRGRGELEPSILEQDGGSAGRGMQKGAPVSPAGPERLCVSECVYRVPGRSERTCAEARGLPPVRGALPPRGSAARRRWAPARSRLSRGSRQGPLPGAGTPGGPRRFLARGPFPACGWAPDHPASNAGTVGPGGTGCQGCYGNCRQRSRSLDLLLLLWSGPRSKWF